MKVKIELEPGAKMPTKAHEHDAGFDLYLHRSRKQEQLGLSYIYDTGVHVAIPEGYVGLVLPRSSISNQGLVCPVGVIDSGYTGTIKVILYTYEAEAERKRFGDWIDNINVYVKPLSLIYGLRVGDRIAQLVILPLPQIELELGDVSSVKTARGDKGFGSSGV